MGLKRKFAPRREDSEGEEGPMLMLETEARRPARWSRLFRTFLKKNVKSTLSILLPKNLKDISLFSDPVTLPKKPEPATPDAEGGDGADAEDVQRFVSSVRSSSVYHGLLEGSSSSKPLFQIFQILQILK